MSSYDGKYSLTELLKLCWMDGDAVEVFCPGGEKAVRRRGLTPEGVGAWLWRWKRSGDSLNQMNWISGNRFKVLAEELGVGTDRVSADRQDHFEGKERWDGILYLCRISGDDILVGFWGGERSLRSADFSYLKNEREFKWRRVGFEGPMVPTNWISGLRFLLIADELQRQHPSI